MRFKSFELIERNIKIMNKTLKEYLKCFLLRLRGQQPLTTYIKNGLKVGKNFWHGNNCSFDISHCWLITIGDNVTFASRVMLLAHDASTKKLTGYTKIGLIEIKDNVFIGAGTIILPNVKIGANAIVGAGSVVTKNIPTNEVWGGVPAKKICSVEDFKNKYSNLDRFQMFDESYTVRAGINQDKKQQMIDILKESEIAFVK